MRFASWQERSQLQSNFKMLIPFAWNHSQGTFEFLSSGCLLCVRFWHRLIGLLSQRSILAQTMGSKLRQKHNSGCFSFVARFTNICWVALLWKPWRRMKSIRKKMDVRINPAFVCQDHTPFLEVCQREFQFWKHWIIMGWKILECGLTQCKREIVARDFYFWGNSLSGRNYNFLTMLPCTPARQITPFQFPNVFFLYVPRMIIFYITASASSRHSVLIILQRNLTLIMVLFDYHVLYCFLCKSSQETHCVGQRVVWIWLKCFEKGAGNYLHASQPKQKILLFVQRFLEIFWPWFFSSNPGRFWWCEWEEATGSAWSGFLIRLLFSLCWCFLDLVEISNFK